MRRFGSTVCPTPENTIGAPDVYTIDSIALERGCRAQNDDTLYVLLHQRRQVRSPRLVRPHRQRELLRLCVTQGVMASTSMQESTRGTTVHYNEEAPSARHATAGLHESHSYVIAQAQAPVILGAAATAHNASARLLVDGVRLEEDDAVDDVRVGPPRQVDSRRRLNTLSSTSSWPTASLPTLASAISKPRLHPHICKNCKASQGTFAPPQYRSWEKAMRI